MTAPLELDLRAYREAANRRLFGLRIGLGVFGAILIGGAIGITLSRIPNGDELHFPYYVLDFLAILTIPLLGWGYRLVLVPGATAIRISTAGITFEIGPTRKWETSWSASGLLMVLADYRIGTGREASSDPFLLSAKLPGIGRSTLLSATAFEAILETSRRHGLTLSVATVGEGTPLARKVITITGH